MTTYVMRDVQERQKGWFPLYFLNNEHNVAANQIQSFRRRRTLDGLGYMVGDFLFDSHLILNS